MKTSDRTNSEQTAADKNTRSVTRREIIGIGGFVMAALAIDGLTVTAQTPVNSTKKYTANEKANLTAMKSYFDGLKAKDVSRVLFAPDVTFATVLIPKPATGEAAVRKLTADFARRLQDVRVDRLLMDGDFGCARFEIDWDKDVVAHSIDYMTFTSGLIKSIEVYWDPREFLAWQERLNKQSRS